MLNSAARFLAPTAARFPEKVAVEDDQGAFTWRELEEAVVRSASALLARGLEADRPVLVYLPKSRESVVSFLAALYAGCPYAPVDYAIPPERLARTLENLRPAFVITDLEGLEHLGICLDAEKTRNAVGGDDISADGSPVRIYVVDTDEEIIVARKARALLPGAV